MIEVRPEEIDDQETVYAVQAAAFGQPNEADLVVSLRRAAQPQLSLVADVAGRVVGHVFFSPVSVESSVPVPPVAGLAPLAVEPSHQGQGIGGALVRAGLERCAELGWKAVFLVGSPVYYGRFGFELAVPLGFRYREPLDPALQVTELEPGALAGVSGAIHYHAAFAETGTA